MAEVPALRGELDRVDGEMVRLIARRLEIATEIGHAKAERKDLAPGGVRDPGREREVMEKAEALARELSIPVHLVRKIFGELVSYSLTRQVTLLAGRNGGAAGTKALQVSFPGHVHSYAHLAAEKYFGSMGLSPVFVGEPSLSELFASLADGSADYAVVPFENPIAGNIAGVYARIRDGEFSIAGEEIWKIEHALAGVAGASADRLRAVYAQPQAVERANDLLHSSPGAEVRLVADAAEGMRLAAEAADPAVAALGPPEAAAAYGLAVLRASPAGAQEENARFLVLSKQPAVYDPRIPCKTSIVFSTRHEKGALLPCLDVLARNEISMTKLESHPHPEHPWEYEFQVDFEGNQADDRIARALEEMRGRAGFLKVLGSYPARAVPNQPQSAEIPSTAASGAPGTTAVAKDPTEVARPAAFQSKNYKLASRGNRSEDTIVRVGNLLIGGTGFVVMAGPCSVESKEQILSTARRVKELGAQVLRGGTFKPRTSPYAFQGLGFDGLELLAEAGREVGLPIITEVMEPQHVRQMAKLADILQVGARNVQNFPLLKELGKVNRPVLLKRGLSSTIDETLGAAEYILAQGNGQVILCERGIRTFETATRNTLDLSAVLVMKERTHLPVIVDPSHGTGKRAYVAPMAFASRAVGAHGLIIEVHPDPDHALSDGDQSLTFDEFAALMTGLSRVPAPV